MEPVQERGAEGVSELMKGAPVAPPPRSKGTLAKLMARATTDQAGNGGKIRRRRFRITVPPEACELKMFDADFEVVIEAPSTAVELEAMKKAGGNPMLAMHEMTRMGILTVDGDPVSDHDMTRETFWEALGLAGRALLVNKWQELVSPPDGTLKKVDASVVIL